MTIALFSLCCEGNVRVNHDPEDTCYHICNICNCACDVRSPMPQDSEDNQTHVLRISKQMIKNRYSALTKKQVDYVFEKIVDQMRSGYYEQCLYEEMKCFVNEALDLS